MNDRRDGRLVLEKVKIDVRQFMSDEAASAMEANLVADRLAGGVVYGFKTYLLGNTVHTERETYRHPASWWQGFKAALFPAWLRRHYPVRYKEVVIMTKFTHVCPHLNIADRGEERFHLQWLTPPSWEGWTV
jgi:hypothetical protein